MRVALFASLAALASVALYLGTDFSGLSGWVIEQQRGFQNQMARAVQALKTGQPSAYFALLFAAGAYGFVHALGPGHGKYLVGGMGFGTRVSAPRLLRIAALSSLAQSAWAIFLVYGGFFLLEATAAQLTTLAEDVLAPASYLAIALVGLFLVFRGVSALASQYRATELAPAGHAPDCGCGHEHGPTADQVAQLGSLREMLALIASVAIRPCTGAIFLLVIAWQMDLRLSGALAVLVMGLGTAALTGLVALSSIAARGLTLASADRSGIAAFIFPAGQIFAGALVLWISVGLFFLVI